MFQGRINDDLEAKMMAEFNFIMLLVAHGSLLLVSG